MQVTISLEKFKHIGNYQTSDYLKILQNHMMHMGEVKVIDESIDSIDKTRYNTPPVDIVDLYCKQEMERNDYTPEATKILNDLLHTFLVIAEAKFPHELTQAKIDIYKRHLCRRYNKNTYSNVLNEVEGFLSWLYYCHALEQRLTVAI